MLDADSFFYAVRAAAVVVDDVPRQNRFQLKSKLKISQNQQTTVEKKLCYSKWKKSTQTKFVSHVEKRVLLYISFPHFHS
jgi:hypothetical protein